MKGCERCKEVIYCDQMHQVPLRPLHHVVCYSPMFICSYSIGGSIGKSVRGGGRLYCTFSYSDLLVICAITMIKGDP